MAKTWRRHGEDMAKTWRLDVNFFKTKYLKLTKTGWRMHSYVQLIDFSHSFLNNKTLFQIFSFQTTKKIFEHVFLNIIFRIRKMKENYYFVDFQR
jgi:hypothetical protein